MNNCSFTQTTTHYNLFLTLSEEYNLKNICDQLILFTNTVLDNTLPINISLDLSNFSISTESRQLERIESIIQNLNGLDLGLIVESFTCKLGDTALTNTVESVKFLSSLKPYILAQKVLFENHANSAVTLNDGVLSIDIANLKETWEPTSLNDSHSYKLIEAYKDIGAQSLKFNLPTTLMVETRAALHSSHKLLFDKTGLIKYKDIHISAKKHDASSVMHMLFEQNIIHAEQITLDMTIYRVAGNSLPWKLKCNKLILPPKYNITSSFANDCIINSEIGAVEASNQAQIDNMKILSNKDHDFFKKVTYPDFRLTISKDSHHQAGEKASDSVIVKDLQNGMTTEQLVNLIQQSEAKKVFLNKDINSEVIKTLKTFGIKCYKYDAKKKSVIVEEAVLDLASNDAANVAKLNDILIETLLVKNSSQSRSVTTKAKTFEQVVSHLEAQSDGKSHIILNDKDLLEAINNLIFEYANKDQYMYQVYSSGIDSSYNDQHNYEGVPTIGEIVALNEFIHEAL